MKFHASPMELLFRCPDKRIVRSSLASDLDSGNSDVSATNESDRTKNLMILKFKDGPAEQALVRSEAPRPEASQ